MRLVMFLNYNFRKYREFITGTRFPTRLRIGDSSPVSCELKRHTQYPCPMLNVWLNFVYPASIVLFNAQRTSQS